LTLAFSSKSLGAEFAGALLTARSIEFDVIFKR
jgi:hypothetical protein